MVKRVVSRVPPPVLRYVYEYPGMVIIIVQDLISTEVVSITSEEYEVY